MFSDLLRNLPHWTGTIVHFDRVHIAIVRMGLITNLAKIGATKLRTRGGIAARDALYLTGGPLAYVNRFTFYPHSMNASFSS